MWGVLMYLSGTKDKVDTSGIGALHDILHNSCSHVCVVGLLVYR
jgi:hypothetical protein